MNKPPNPPAFPNQEHAWDGTQKSIYASEGMTLRDYFAAKAMAAMLTSDATKHDWSNAKVVIWSYEIADDMLRARSEEL